MLIGYARVSEGPRNLMVLNPSQTRALYRRRAPHYDRLTGLFRLAGAELHPPRVSLAK